MCDDKQAGAVRPACTPIERRTLWSCPNVLRRYDPDERFRLDADPEDVLRRLLVAEDVPPDEDDPMEDEGI